MTTETVTPTTYQPSPAAQSILDRYDRLQSRDEHPDGRFDCAGRWYPTTSLPCCDRIRSPRRAYPYSYMVHCRTLDHVLAEMGADEETRREVKSVLAWRRGRIAEIRRAKLAEPVTAYKSVAMVDGVMRSIYDGATIYAIGTTLRQQAKSNHGGGYYLYATPEEAQDAHVPVESKLLTAPRVVIECECSGRRVEYNNGKTAYSTVIPLAVVASVLPRQRAA